MLMRSDNATARVALAFSRTGDVSDARHAHSGAADAGRLEIWLVGEDGSVEEIALGPAPGSDT